MQKQPAPFNLTVYGCDELEQWKLIVQKYIDNMISQFHGIVLMQIGFILAFFAASRYCKQFTHRLCPVLQWSRLLTALQNDDLRRAVQLSLTGCCNLARNAACWINLVEEDGRRPQNVHGMGSGVVTVS